MAQEKRTLKIEIHKTNAVNLKLFLDALGFKSVWGKVNDDWEALTVFQDEREAMLKAIVKELDKTTWVPYHLSFTPENKGKTVKDERVEFVGKPSQINEFQNVSGRFRLVLFEINGVNYLWKVYSAEKDIDPSKNYKVTGRVVCMLEGLRKEKLVLINRCRLKEIENES